MVKQKMEIQITEPKKEEKKKGGTRCFICGAGPLKRPIQRVPLIYPYGTKEHVPICRHCASKVRAIVIEVRKNPHLQVVYKLIMM
jgi:hypothetical protein